jgi:glycerol dehydrogenase
MGLPTTLADLKIVEDVEAKIERVATAALKNPDDIIYATPVALSVPLLRDSILALDAFSRALD